VRTVKHHSKIYFPFSAIVGMENAKLALMVNAVNPLIGGVVLAGDKGTGKSTLVRAFAQVLPEQPVAKGCPFNCNPFNPLEMCDVHYDLWSKDERIEYESRKIRVVDLPLNATPDRVAGSIDIEQTIKTGRVAFKPGAPRRGQQTSPLHRRGELTRGLYSRPDTRRGRERLERRREGGGLLQAPR
jgi:Mg-chelatase subunit ChlI